MERDTNQSKRKSSVYSAPRRFDLATVFVGTTAFALFYATLNALGAPPMVVAILTALVTLVALGQAALFGGNHPRLASLLVGLTIFATTGAILLLADQAFRPEDLVPAVLFTAFGGLFWGYIAGVLVGSIFMVAHVIRKLAGRKET